MCAASESGTPDRIGSFRVLRELGRGGMGIVYLGERVQDFQQRVAIKILYANTLTGAEEEEVVLRSLDHSGIVRLFDHGRLPGGTEYLVMEFVDGVRIDEYCARHDLSQALRIKLLLQASDAVAHAHSRFVTHADLKPSNLLVTEDGTVKLLDFGLATRQIAPGTAARISHYSPGYSSPEQRLGAPGSVAGDIYALGRTANTVLARADEPVPKALGAIFRKAGQQEPSLRYRTVREFAADLEAFLAKRPIQAYRRDRLYRAERWTRRNPAIAALLFSLLLILVGSTVGIAVETVHAVRSRRATEARLEELVAQTGTLQGELYRSLPADPAADAARHSLLVHVTETLGALNGHSGDDPALAAALAEQYRTLGRLQAVQQLPGAMQRGVAP